MMKKYLVLALILAPFGYTDTIELTTGVKFDGTVRELPNGILEVDVDGSKLLYTAAEIVSIEKNDRTGALDLAEIEAQLAAEDAEMQARTGLTRQQREEVLEILYQLQTSEDTERVRLRDRLVAMQQRFNVYGFLTHQLPELSHRLTPAVLEVLCYISADQSVGIVRGYLTDSFAGTRAKAIELLGVLRDSQSQSQISRGLADHDDEVVLSALHALSLLHARQATPAMIELQSHANLRVNNASRRALETLWADAAGVKMPANQAEWNALWEQQRATVSGAYQLASLSPLIPPEREFQNE